MQAALVAVDHQLAQLAAGSLSRSAGAKTISITDHMLWLLQLAWCYLTCDCDTSLATCFRLLLLL